MALYAIPILAFVLFASSAMGRPPEPPPGPPTFDVNVVNTPLPVTGDVTATVTGDVNVINEEADAVPVKIVDDGTGSHDSRIQLVGFSSGKATGLAGRLAMDRVCRQDFPGSRMCRTAEALATVDRSELAAGDGWIDPSTIEVIHDPTHDTYISYDPHSGVAGFADEAWYALWAFNCNGWGQGGPPSAGTVLNISTDGKPEVDYMRFTQIVCTADRRVACCR
jgi:hypothetical protein